MAGVLLLALMLVADATALPVVKEPRTFLARVNISSPQVLDVVRSLDVWSNDGATGLGDVAHVRLDKESHSALGAVGASVDILVPDLEALAMQERARIARADSTSSFSSDYHSYEEIVDRLQRVASAHSNVDFIANLGSSIEGRDVPVLRIGRSPELNGAPTKTVWFQCGIHAREWISPAACMFFIDELLGNKEAEHLLKDLQIMIAPVVNPDGYAFTHSDDRYWRKNRRVNKDGSMGVDLNRNWGDHWGEGGASPDPSSDTYRGPKPFSEPETNNIVKFLTKQSKQGSSIEAAIDFHAYGQLILRPYGWTNPTNATPPNDEKTKEIADAMRDAIKDTHGMDYTSEHAAELYVASGGADDWFGAKGTAMNLALTLELRDTGRYGFVLPPDQIVPTGEEVYRAVLVFLEAVLDSQH